MENMEIFHLQLIYLNQILQIRIREIIGKMMDKINRQFDILTTQAKRFQKLSETYSTESTLFSALVGAIKSVAMISSNISTSFIQILSLDQIKVLFKNNYSLINEITNKMTQLNTKIQQMKKQKQSMKTKGNNQNCTICGENIHQSNIKQAKIYLEEQSRQKFQLAMEQFKKIADAPIHTKEQNYQFEQKLHYQLSQRERVLNTNCNRIGEYVEVMEGALADLMKMKQIELNQNQIQNVQFINMNKINEDVSNMLQNSFLKKIPPWIHKMFLKMVASYVQECNRRKQEKSIQTAPSESISSKQMREYVKEKRQIQKENKELSDQLKQLKLCYKKLQEINNQYSLTIASLSRNIKHRTQTYKQQKSKRNSKHTVKGQKDKEQRIESLSNNAENPDEDYDMYDEINFTKKKRTRLFPQIKNKYESNITKKGGKVQPIQFRRQNSIDKNSHGKLTQRSKDATSRKKILDDTESNERQSYKKEDSTDRKRNDRRPSNQRNQQIGRESVQNQEKTKMREKRYQENNQNGRKSKQIQYNIKNRSTKKSNPSSNSTKILIKNNKINGVVSKKQFIEGGGRELSDDTSNLPNNKRNYDSDKKNNRSHDLEQNDDINQSTYHQLESYQNNSSIEALSDYNRKNNQKQLMFVKKVSENLSNKINIKKNSLYGAVETNDQNQNSSAVLRKSVKNIGLYQSSNTQVNKNTSISKYQNRFQDINKENLKEYIKICKDNKKSDSENQPEERNSQIHESKNNRKSLNHQYEYRQKVLKEKSLKDSKISTNNISQSKDAQRKIFQLLKSNQILQKSVNYKQFVALISNLSPNPLNEEEYAMNQGTNLLRQSGERKSSLTEQGNQQNLDLAHNSIYGRLFVNKVVAYKYEQSMAKSYHKRVLKQLNELQRDYCYEMYSNLCEAKKIGKETYHQFCSILRYPYQTLYNNFEVVNFMTDMSFDTFQYFFRKIIWIHRKCVKAPNQVVCQHIGSVSQQLKEILKLKS